MNRLPDGSPANQHSPNADGGQPENKEPDNSHIEFERIEDELRKLVVGHIMTSGVKPYLNADVEGLVDDGLMMDEGDLTRKIRDIETRYQNSGGDMSRLVTIKNLLKFDENGFKAIADFFNRTSIGLEKSADSGKKLEGDFYTEAKNSADQIIRSFIKTGSADVYGPDGKLYKMRLGAKTQAEGAKEMTDDFVNKNIKNGLPGDYVLNSTSMADSLLHGDLINKDSLQEIEGVLESESGRECPAITPNGEGYTYKFVSTPLSQGAVRSYEFTTSNVPGGDVRSLVLPSTFAYSLHRKVQWKHYKQATSDTSSQDESFLPESDGQKDGRADNTPSEPGLRSSDRSVTAETGSGDVGDMGDAKPGISLSGDNAGMPPGRMPVDPRKKPSLREIATIIDKVIRRKQAEENRTAAENGEVAESGLDIYNSAANYFQCRVSRSDIDSDGHLLVDINSPSFFELSAKDSKYCEDCSGEIIGETSSLFVLADGVGGMAGGDITSEVTVKAFIDAGLTEIADKQEDLRSVIGRAIQTMKKRIVAARKAVIESSGDSTVIAAEVIGNKLVYGSVGDSSLFVVRNGKFILVAGDRGGHSNFISNSVRGEDNAVFKDPPEDLLGNQSLDELSRAERIGDGDLSAADKIAALAEYDSYGVFELEDGDRVVLCSDGIMGDWSKLPALSWRDGVGEQTLADEDIVKALDTEKTLDGVELAIRRLMSIAKKPDDRTVQMFDIRLR